MPVRAIWPLRLMSEPVLLQLSADTRAVAVAGMLKSDAVLNSPWTHRPRNTGSVNGLLLALTNCIHMNGFPPTPPSTGCLGI